MDGYGKRVLVVEDNEDARRFLSILLLQAGYNVCEVENCVDALHEMKKRHYDVVITDYSMPKLNGVELLFYSRIVAPGMPLIIVSAEQSSVATYAVQQGAYAWIRKPYDGDMLLETVRSAIRQSSREQAKPMTSRMPGQGSDGHQESAERATSHSDRRVNR